MIAAIILVAGIVFLLVNIFKPKNYYLNFISEQETILSVDIKNLDSLEMPEDPIKEGYVFNGWYFDNGTWTNEFNKDEFVLSIEQHKNYNVYAYFKEECVNHNFGEWQDVDFDNKI